MGDIIDVDFGKSTNEATRRFLTLLGRIEDFENDVLKRPLFYLDLASKRMAEMSQTLRDADEAALAWCQPTVEPHDLRPHPMPTMVVDRREYMALKKMEKIIGAAVHGPL